MSAKSLSKTGRLQPEETSTDGNEQYQFYNISSNSISEIEEDDSRELPKEVKELFGMMREFEPMPSIREEEENIISSSNWSSFDGQPGQDSVFVAVGKSESSMDALAWTLKHAINPSSSSSSSTMVYLIHIFSEVRYIPSPLGKLSVNHVNPEQVKTYTAQEEGKRRELLQKFLATCSAAKVEVDTVLIESDSVGKAILDLIPILNIRKLVLGTSKNNSRKLRSRKGSGILAYQILKGAPESCEIKIICAGNEVIMDQLPLDYSPSPRRNADDSKSMQDQENQLNQSFSFSCFKP